MTLLTLFVSLFQAGIAALNLRNGFFLFVFFYATYPRLLAIGLGSEGFAISAQRMMIFGLLLLMILRFLFGSKDLQNALRTARANWQICLFMILMLGARLVGNFATGRVDSTVYASLIDETCFTLVVFLLCLTCLKTRRDIYTLLFVIALSLAPNQIAVFIETVMQKSIFPASLQIDFETSRSAEIMLEGSERFGLYRVMGTFDSSLMLMEVTTIILPLVIYFAIHSAEQKWRILMGIIAAIAPITIFLTGSRTGVMLLAVTASFYGYRFCLKRFGKTEGTLLLLFLATAVGVFLYFNIQSMIQNFLLSGGAGYSTASRVFQYVFSWPLILESPYYGYGYARNIVDVIDLKSLDGYYLRIVLEGGIISLFSLFAIQFKTWRSLASVRGRPISSDDRELAISLQTSVALIAIMMLALNMSVSFFYAFLFAGVAVQMKNLMRSKDPKLQQS